MLFTLLSFSQETETTCFPPGEGASEGTKMNTLPEEIDTELAELRRKLAGNRAFGACRGDMNFLRVESLLEADTPTEVLARFDKWAAARRVMLNLLATLKRDGKTTAHSQLLKALKEDGYVITGEEIPLEQTESGVLVIPNLRQTLTILHWLYSSRREDAVKWLKANGGKIDDNDTSLIARMFREVPSLVTQLLDLPKPTNWQYGTHTPPTMHLKPQRASFFEKIHAHLDTLGKRSSCHYLFADQEYSNFTDKYDNALGCLVSTLEQADILSVFSRKEQRGISTWRFNYPKVDSRKLGSSRLDGCLSDVTVGLHPESEHTMWRKLWPSYTSIGCSDGWGAIILLRHMTENWRTEPNPIPLYRGLHGSYCLKDLKVPIEQHRVTFKVNGGDRD